MRTFALKDLVYSVKMKQEILNKLTKTENKIYLGLYPSLLMLGVRLSLPASLIQYTVEPLEDVKYLRLLGINVISPKDCARLLTSDIQTNSEQWTPERRVQAVEEATVLAFSKMANQDKLDIVLHELDNDYESLFDEYPGTIPKDSWFFQTLETTYPQIIITPNKRGV